MKYATLAHVMIAGTMLCSNLLNAQLSLSGKIVSDKGEPVPFAVAGIVNTQLTAVSKADGSYAFASLKPGTYVVLTRCLGYTEKHDTLVLNSNLETNLVLQASNKQLDEVLVNATRVDKNSGMAFSNIDAETLQKQNLGQDAPYMLAQLPSAVVNSDAGNGVGYTGIRIRGSDGTRINVTINGVPVNDAESQATFFVDMPDLVSSTNNIQVQRGAGASSNGAGAFGATINFQTNKLNDKPYANVISTAGSYNTFRNTLAAGTGLLNNHFVLDARASNISSNGYIDRSSSKLQSYYLSGAYYGKKTVLKFINFLGQEKTGQAWNYTLEDSIKRGNRTYNSCGALKDANGNPTGQFYKNETDNYKQNNFQLHLVHQFSNRLSLNVTGHYTKGKGYYEQYKQNQSMSDYGMANVVTDSGDVISSTDLIRRLWLDNDFAGGLFNLNYTANSKLAFTLGGGYNTYFGKHFGRLMWARFASNSETDMQYSMYTTNKNDGNVYLKTNYKVVSGLNVFVDLQMRQVAYRYFGYADTVNQRYQNQAYSFFNPKVGLSYDVNSHVNLYSSLSVANKEPSGDDLSKNKILFRPKSEQLIDLEAGIKYAAKNLMLAANFYNMQYTNQLVLNGQIDNVGNPKHVNVASSYRRGLELEANINLGRYLVLGGNITLSSNKIANFTEYQDSSDASYSVYYEQHVIKHKNTDISFSPNTVSSALLTFKPVKNMEITFINKYVGRQYLDNTSNAARSLSAYMVQDLRFNYRVKTSLIPEINFMLSVYNLGGLKYSTNGYTYSYYAGSDFYTQNYLSPAALTNFMGGINLKF